MDEHNVKFCTANLIRKASREISRELDKVLKNESIRGTQFSLLITIDYFDSISVVKLSKFMNLERTSLTRNLSTLSKLNLIEINEDSSDARVKLITLTSKGRDKASRSLVKWKDFQQKYVEKIGKAEWETFVNTLIKISKSENNEN